MRPKRSCVLEKVPAGQVQPVLIKELLPRTAYTVAIRAYDECRNVGPIAVLHLQTPRPEPGTVDACFIATAAYGSKLAGEVSALRAFRDAALRSNLPGEIAVEGYYTFGPLLARTIAPSETLRRAARAAPRAAHRARSARPVSEAHSGSRPPPSRPPRKAARCPRAGRARRRSCG
jgi:hypothetical protein